MEREREFCEACVFWPIQMFVQDIKLRIVDEAVVSTEYVCCILSYSSSREYRRNVASLVFTKEVGVSSCRDVELLHDRVHFFLFRVVNRISRWINSGPNYNDKTGSHF